MESFKKIFGDWGVPVIIAVFTALLINKYIIFNIEVPTGSMIPTIGINEKFLATRVHNFENIKRGDILIFDSNFEDELYVKRLIGLPGDEVQIKDGLVSVNGQLIEEDYVKYPVETNGVYHVPEDSYFFLGDNRAGSNDSRMWDDPYIKRESIKGKAQIRIYPLNKFGTID